MILLIRRKFKIKVLNLLAEKIHIKELLYSVSEKEKKLFIVSHIK